MWILLIVEAVLFGAAAGYTHREYAPWLRGLPGCQNELWRYCGPPALWMMDKAGIAERFPEAVGKVHHIMIGLHGAKVASAYTKAFIASLILWIYGLFSLVTLLACVSDGNAEMLAYGALLAVFAPFLLYKQISDRLKRKKRLMLLELPEPLNELTLLVNAGETVQQALTRSVEAKGPESGPLLAELTTAVQALKMNASFSKVMEDFSKRCALQEVSLFTTTLLLNYRRGGEELVMSLRELSVTLWDKRKALARTLGEEASSKLVFPMVLIFFVVMVMVAAPALMMMS
ncbi:type II secretion system F family protein [Paenibacillus sp. P25]|nr:type II secretion system F family protein [Paenibacillus sp. P25]